MPVVDDYTALLSGNYWNGIEVTGSPVIVTFSFPTTAPSYDSSVDGFTAATLSSFQAFTPTEQAQAIAALNEWAAASGLIFIQVDPGQGDINFQNVDFDTTTYSGAGGIAFYPFGNWYSNSYPYFTGDLDASGDVFMNSQFLSGDSVNYGTLLHEIGHAIGLKHPTEIVTDTAAIPPVTHDEVLASDDPDATIMSTVGDASVGAGSALRQLDIDAAAFVYGPGGNGAVVTSSTTGTNGVWDWSWNAITQTVTLSALTIGAVIRGTSVNDIIDGSTGDDKLFGLAGDNQLNGREGNDFLYGGSGTNLLTGGAGDDSYSVASLATTVVELASEGNDTVYATVSFTLPDNVEVLYLYGDGLTGHANDQGVSMFGDGTHSSSLFGGAGIDYIVGGSLADLIAGGGGPDTMYGEGGADTFVFTALADAPIGGLLSTIGDFVSGEDKIDLSAITTTGTNAGQPLSFIGTGSLTNQAGEIRQDTVGSDTLLEGDVDGDGSADFEIRLLGTVTPQASDFLFAAPPCYRIGTRILTERGERQVEDLRIGDRVMTPDGQAQPISWIGIREVDCTCHPDPTKVWPILIRPGAFDDRQPNRPLFLSPDHCVFIDGVLIPVRQLVNGATIAQVPMDTVTYYHIELPSHDTVFADGLLVETYLDTGNRWTFANAGDTAGIDPELTTPKTWDEHGFAPLAIDEARVRPVWDRLAERALLLGQPVPRLALTDDPAISLRIGHSLIAPTGHGSQRYRFAIPADAEGPIRLISRSSRPNDSRPWLEDTRMLGLYVRQIVWHDQDGRHDLPLSDPELREGWWDVEMIDGQPHRWTNGDALITDRPDIRLPGALEIEVDVAGTLPYRLAVLQDDPPAQAAPNQAHATEAA